MSASRMKKRASSSQDLHPKLEITDAFDLFLNADLCECVFPCRQLYGKRETRLAQPEISLHSQCRHCCVEWNSAQTYVWYIVHVSTQKTCFHSLMLETHTHTHASHIISLFSEWLKMLWKGAVRNETVLSVFSVVHWNDNHRVFCLYLPILIFLLQ